jgi:ribose transport system permease protein
MTLIILTEGIDLSLGPVLGLCGVGAGLMIVAGYPLPLAVGIAILIGTCFGLLNGTLIAVAGLPPFIVTLGSFGIAQSIATVLTRGDSIVNLPAYFRWFNDGIFLGMPVPIVATLVVFVVTWVLLYHTKLAATHSRLAAIGKR